MGGRGTRAVLGTVVIGAWLGGVGWGFGRVWDYATAPGSPASAPVWWPADSDVPRADGSAALVVFLHPQCACSRATVSELARLMARAPARVTTYALVHEPPDAPDDWTASDLVVTAAAIPGVHVLRDVGGREATRFGVVTSGQVVLYDGGGRLAFAGGITPARGHAGDSVGRDAVLALLAAAPPPAPTTPVFGCALATPDR